MATILYCDRYAAIALIGRARIYHLDLAGPGQPRPHVAIPVVLVPRRTAEDLAKVFGLARSSEVRQPARQTYSVVSSAPGWPRSPMRLYSMAP
jgi:hypothetical protein